MPARNIYFAAHYTSPYTVLTPASNTAPNLSGGSLYNFIPLPSMPVALHPILTVQYPHAVEYDLTLKPNTMRLFTYAVPVDLWEQQASLPPLPFFKISIPGTQWHVAVFPSSQDASGVTVGDVFTAIYLSLRTNVRKHEYESAPSDEDRNSAREAYNARVGRMHPSLREFERAKGLKRIDFLGKRRHFLGLMPVKGALTLLVE